MTEVGVKRLPLTSYALVPLFKVRSLWKQALRREQSTWSLFWRCSNPGREMGRWRKNTGGEKQTTKMCFSFSNHSGQPEHSPLRNIQETVYNTCLRNSPVTGGGGWATSAQYPAIIGHQEPNPQIAIPSCGLGTVASNSLRTDSDE